MTWKQISAYGYDVSDDGQVRNRVTQRILKATVNNRGRRMVSLRKDGNTHHFYVHRLVAEAFIPNPDDKSLVDHIDRNPLNNRVSNLRWCSSAENNRNATKRSNTSSSFKGVCWDKSRQKWVTHIKINYKLHSLGRFSNEIHAALAYNHAARDLFGEFANLNTIPDDQWDIIIDEKDVKWLN